MHFGFVDEIEDYHTIVHKNPYSMTGLFEFLRNDSDPEKRSKLDRLEALYRQCHGYVHGNVIGAIYPLLHYLEISLILGNIVPDIYTALCTAAGTSTDLGFDIMARFREDFAEMQEQYQ